MAKLVAIIFLFLSTSLDAQTVIMGKVIANSGDPVSGVHIYCIENEKGATTDSLGFFQLECIIPSTLEFTHINYKKETYKLTKSDVPFVIILRNKRNNLKEVVVTALPASGRVLSSIKGIERIPAILGEQDVLKYLATMPGIVTTTTRAVDLVPAMPLAIGAYAACEAVAVALGGIGALRRVIGTGDDPFAAAQRARIVRLALTGASALLTLAACFAVRFMFYALHMTLGV